MKPPKELKLLLCNHAECVPECDECPHAVLCKHHQIAESCDGGFCRYADKFVRCIWYTYRLVPKGKKEAK